MPDINLKKVNFGQTSTELTELFVLINTGSQWSAVVEMRFGLIKRSDELSG